MSIEGQGHFFTIYFPGFVCFMLYLDKISGERLQDHWSSGLVNCCIYGLVIILEGFQWMNASVYSQVVHAQVLDQLTM